jgi:hypothetical protein
MAGNENWDEKETHIKLSVGKKRTKWPPGIGLD